MGILISKIRVENFRSIENLELSLSMTNVLIGANNSGKSNFLKAINVALGQNKIVSSDDIYVGKDGYWITPNVQLLILCSAL